MTLPIEEDLRSRYALFNSGLFDDLGDWFAKGAVYNQLNSSRTVAGRDQIREVLAGWTIYFQGARIANITVTEASAALLSEEPNATHCYAVEFTGTGVYAQTIPGLELIAPATGAEVELPISETVWLNREGLIIRVDNAVNVRALLIN